MRGKWAAGIEPRNFTWVFEGRLAVSERPGGATRVHRKVRRDEEMLWLKRMGFTRIISILPPNNLPEADFAVHGIEITHVVLRDGPGQRDSLVACYEDLRDSFKRQSVVLLHGDEVTDRLLGLIAGFLVWVGKVPSDTMAIAMTEQKFKSSIGSDGRSLVLSVSSPS